MNDRMPKHKSVYILPNLFTSASLFCGFLSIVFSADGKFQFAAIAILISAVLDGLDGRVARLTGTASEFGVQYDSLADLVAFGVAPAFMVYKLALFPYKRIGLAVAFLFAVCAALRLARFNVTAPTSTTSKRFFIGLPTPAAGCTLAIFVLFIPTASDTLGPSLAFITDGIMHNLSSILFVLTTVIGLLMVSQFRYAAFKEMGFLKAHPFRYMVFAVLVFVIIVAHPKASLFLLLYGYVLSGFVSTFILLTKRKGLAVSQKKMRKEQ